MAEDIIELTEDVDLLDALTEYAGEQGQPSAWYRAIGTVSNAVFQNAAGGDVVCPGVVQLVHADIVVINSGKPESVQASATVTKDGKSTVCGQLTSANVVSVMVHSTINEYEQGTPDEAFRKAVGTEEIKTNTPEESSSPESLASGEATGEERMAPPETTSTDKQAATSSDNKDSDNKEISADTEASENPWAAVAATSDELKDKEESSPSQKSSSNAWGKVAEVSDSVKDAQNSQRSSSAKQTPDPSEGSSTEHESPGDKLRAFAENMPDIVDVDELQYGDELEHPILGMCTVMKVVNSDAALVSIRGGKTRKLMLRIFEITRIDEGRYELQKKERK